MRVLIGADGQPAQTPNPRPPKESSSNSRSSPQPEEEEEEEEGEPPRKKPKGDDGDCRGTVGPGLDAPLKSEEGSSSSSSSSSSEEEMGGGGRLASSSSGPEAAAALQSGGGGPGEEGADGQQERRRAEGPGRDEGPRAAATAASPHRSAPPRARPRGDRNPEDDDEWHDRRGASRCIFLGKSNGEEGRRTCGDDDRNSPSRGYGKSGRSGLPSSSSLLRPSVAAAPAPLLHGPVPGSADDPATVAKSDRPFDDGNSTAEDGRNDDADDDAPAEAGGPTLAQFVHLLRTQHRPPLDVVTMDGDGNCLFRALSLQVYGDPSMHAEVRRRILDFMEREADHFREFVADEDFARYVARKRADGVHGNHAEIQAASELYCRSAEVYVPGKGIRPINIFHSEYAGLGDAPLRLCYTDGNHYDAVVDPLVPTAGLGLGLPGLQPGLADRMQVAEATKRSETSAGEADRRQLEEATRMSERARKEREDTEVREALAKSAGDAATVKTPYYAGDSDEERMCQKKALYLSEIEAADFDLEQAVLASSLESYHRAEHERKPSSSIRRGDSGRRSWFNASPRGLRSSSNSPVHRTAAAASAAASPSSHHCAAASATAAASSAAASLPSASSQPTAAGLNHSASLTTDEYPPSVQELVMNGFEPSKVLRAYDLVGDSFDDLLSVLLSSMAT